MIAVDASLVFKLLVEETLSAQVADLWRKWNSEGAEIYAPFLLHYEIYNAVRKTGWRRKLDPTDMKKILDVYHGLDITFVADTENLTLALELTEEHHLPAIYDAVYLALAQEMHLEFWTADSKLFNTVSPHLNFVRKVG